MDINTEGTRWLEEHKDDIVNCELRSARFRKKYCYILQKKTPDKGIDEDGSFNDGLSRAVNICRRCSKYRNKLDVTRFLKK